MNRPKQAPAQSIPVKQAPEPHWETDQEAKSSVAPPSKPVPARTEDPAIIDESAGGGPHSVQPPVTTLERGSVYERPVWLEHLRRWQWNSTLLAMLVLAVSYIVVTTATRQDSPLSPAQFAVPSVHYHLPSPQVLTPLRTEASTTAATVVAATKTSEETTSEVNEQKELRLASRSTMDDPVSRPWLSNEAGAADATTNNETETEFGTSTPVLGLLEYPETQFPAYKPSPSMSAEPATVRLDGKIQQFKRGPK